jgi:hypothetical protein
MKTSGQIQQVENLENDELMVDLGDAADLTLGGPSGGREDKRKQVG